MEQKQKVHGRQSDERESPESHCVQWFVWGKKNIRGEPGKHLILCARVNIFSPFIQQFNNFLVFYSLKASFLFYYLTKAFWWALLKLFSDMKCKIFDFLRSMLHNLYRYVDFMFAELTTMTHYLEFQILLKSVEYCKDIYDPIICLRYLLMSMCL